MKIKPKALLKIPVKVDFEIGRTQKDVAEILKFRKGTIVRLEESQKNEIQIYVNQSIFAYGKTLRKDGEIYVEITEIVKTNEEGVE